MYANRRPLQALQHTYADLDRPVITIF